MESEEKTSEQIASMTKEEALEFLGLPADADKEALENKFWQLSKKYRSLKGNEAEQKLADLSAAYDIAAGNRDLRQQAEEARSHEKQFMGKTKDEWKTYFSYTWKYILGAIVLVAVSAALIWNFFFKPREDCGIISIGNFENKTEYYESVVKELGFKHPNLSTFCYVAVSEKDQQADAYTNQAAVATLYSGANVIVTDQSAMPYFFEYLMDCSSLYKQLEQVLPAEKFAKITPVYMSEREYKKLIVEYRLGKGMELSDTNVDYSSYSDAKIMTGLMIDDADMIKKIGYTNYWPDKPATLIFGINVMSKDTDVSASIITAVLMGL